MLRFLITTLSLVVLLPVFASEKPYDALPLRNQANRAFTLRDFSRGYSLLTFFFTSCPMQKMCPLSIRKTKMVLQATKKARGPELNAIGITLDPARDTVKRLAAYSKREGLDDQRFWLATGSGADLDRIASEFNVIGIGQGGAVSHNVRSVLLGPGLRFIKNLDENEWAPEDVVKAIQADTTSFSLADRQLTSPS
ncbi:MAG: SCO family protein [Deltaproteobacteria bacterium]|nr:SCO family protein [Deltaproteobacteria bacterium]MBI3293715.1 SCO family protein [Deltaproteobacteria bacterium]